MFDDIGGKIKGLATALTWIGGGLSIISGIVVATQADNVLPFLLIGGIGFLCAWLSSLCLYGFGELVENSSYIWSAMEQQNRELKKLSDGK